MFRLLLCIMLILTAPVLWAQGYMQAGTAGDDISISGCILNDGSFAAFGHSNGSGQNDAYIIRSDAAGNIKRSFRMGGSAAETGTSVCPTYSGGYVITGSTLSGGAGGRDIYAAAFDATDKLLWTSAYGGSGDEESYEVLECADHGLLIVGYTRSYPNTTYNSYVLKLSEKGVLEWSTVLHTNLTDIAYRALQLDSFYYINSTVNISPTFGKGDVYLSKLDKYGKLLWTKTYGAGQNDQTWKMIRTLDNRLALLFATQTVAGGSKELVLMKLDTAGKKLWARQYTNGGAATDGFDLVQTRDSSYVICGHLYESSSASWQGMLLKADKAGKYLSAGQPSFSKESNLWKIARTGPGDNFVVFGNGYNAANTDYDFIQINCDSSLKVSCKNFKYPQLADKATTFSESAYNSVLKVTTGGSTTLLNWTVKTSALPTRTDLNINKNLSSNLPAAYYRCTLDSLNLDAGPGLQFYAWETGARTRSIFAKQFGTYRLRIGKNYCMNHDSTEIVKVSAPSLDLPADTCGRDSIYLMSHPTLGHVVTWSDGQSARLGKFKGPGMYHVTVTDTVKACISRDSIRIYMPGLQLDLHSEGSEHCLKHNFLRMRDSIQLEIPGDKLLKRFWYADTLLLPDAHPLNYSSTTAGTRKIRVEVYSARGCSGISEINYTVHPDPQVRLLLADSTLCFNGHIATIQDSTGIAQGSFQSRMDWGDGTRRDILQQDTHHFTRTGGYLVKLLAISDQGCRDSAFGVQHIYNNPVADFLNLKAAAQCLRGNNFYFANRSVNYDTGNALYYVWNINPGSISYNSTDLSHSFLAPGKYKIEFSAFSLHNCRDDKTDSVEVWPQPTASLSLSDSLLCAKGSRVTFHNLSSLAQNSMLHTGDGNIFAISDSLLHTYSAPGQYKAELKVSSIQGCSDSTQRDLEILRSPKVVLTPPTDQQCLKGNLFFLSAPASDRLPSDRIQWTLSDGNAWPKDSIFHSFLLSGNYTATCILRSDRGCRDSQSLLLTVHPQPKAGFAVQPVCLGRPSLFLDQSSISSGSINSIEWFGGGSALPIGTGKNASYVYPQPGSFDLLQVVTSDMGCRDSLLKPASVLVWPRPVAAFNWAPWSESLDMDLWAGTGTTPGAVTHAWYFEGQYLQGQKIFKEVTDSQNLWVEYYVTDVNGCSDTARAWQVFPFRSVLFVPNAFSPNGDKLNDVFGPKAYKRIDNYEMLIVDRWGGLIYRNTDILQGWDGMHRNQPAPDGIYVYRIRAGRYEVRGTVQLLR